MEYKIRNNHNDKVVRVFDNLDAAIAWCDKNATKTRSGHRVTHIEGAKLVTDYDTCLIANARAAELNRLKCKQGGCL